MNAQELITALRSRHTCKAYDPQKTIPSEQVEALLEVLRLTPSSVNSQPWHFFLASHDAAKARVAQGMPGMFANNANKVKNASHTVVLCRRLALDEAYLDTLLAQEVQDGRFPSEQEQAVWRQSRAMFTQRQSTAYGSQAPWIEKQVYIALGTLLQSATLLGIDASPLEGFDSAAMDEALGLREQGLTAVVVVTLGYRSADDYNATLPKSRWGHPQVLTRL